MTTLSNDPSGNAAANLPGTLGELRAAGWESLPVKEEIRRNAVTRIAWTYQQSGNAVHMDWTRTQQNIKQAHHLQCSFYKNYWMTQVKLLVMVFA